MDKIYISWEDFHKDTKNLCEKIKDSGNYNKIVAVSRGGLIPAGIISYELKIRNVEAVNVSSYDDDKKNINNKVTFSSNIDATDEKTLIIDDLSDTGSTFRLLKKLFPKAVYATVYTKPKGMNEPNIFAKEMPDQWVVFPWD